LILQLAHNKSKHSMYCVGYRNVQHNSFTKIFFSTGIYLMSLNICNPFRLVLCGAEMGPTNYYSINAIKN